MPDQLIRRGRFVGFTYLIKDSTGEIVDRSDIPITYIHGGRHEVFPQIEKALDAKRADDIVEVPIAYQDAFGEYDPELTFTDDLANAPEQFHIVGAELDMENSKGDIMHFRVTKIEDGKITIDANHPLAGKDITFLLKVREVREPTAEDLKDQPNFTVQ